MRITLFCRNVIGGFSIENMTANLRDNLPPEAQALIFRPRHTNRGLWNKISSVFEAASHQSDINHVTGDTHFLTYLLDKRRTILTIWDCARLMSPELGPLKKAIFKFFWFTLPKYKSACITTVSLETRRNLQRYAGISQERVVVIPTGVDRRFRVLDLSFQEKQRLLENPQGKKAVLHVAVPMPNKNLKRLIEALAGLEVKFIKVGGLTKEELGLLEEHRIDYKHFSNPDKELLVSIYNCADCLVFPSLIEGFGMPVVEAQKCGIPVVTSNVSSLPEVAADAAVLVDPYSVEDIREGINKVLSDKCLRAGLVEKGFANAARFNWDKIALQYYELYKSLTKGRE